MEFAGVIVTPWILLFRVRPKCVEIVDLFCVPEGSNGSDGGVRTNECDFDSSLLQSAIVVENIRRLEKAI